jgi:hypothetical protein
MSVEEVDELDEETSLQIDPDGTPLFLDFWGRKNSGKSHLASIYVRSWPYDALIINNTGDVDPNYEWSTPWPGGEELVERLPNGRYLYRAPWPQHPEGVATVKWNLTPNHRDPHWRYKADAAIAAFHDAGDKRLYPAALPRLLMVDEIGELAGPGDVGPGLDVVLHQGRHNLDWCVFCGPRPMNVATLVIVQADRLHVFKLPAAQDRQRIAREFGVDEAALTDTLQRLGEHGFAVIDISRPDLIVAFPEGIS